MDLADLRIGFIGAGRLGQSIAWQCARRGLRVAATASRASAGAETLAARIPGCEMVTPQQVADRCDLVFITTPDAAIRPTADALQWRAGSSVVHCSGATEVTELAKAASDGAHVGGFHPLQTFGDSEAAARSLPGCTVTVEAKQPLDALLVDLADRLGCRVNRLPPGARPLYHAAAGYSSQFVNALLHEASRMWRSWGASEQAAVRALLPLVRGTLASIEHAGVGAGMPGPVSRGDVGSVEKHITSIAKFDPYALPLYRELCGRTVQIAHGQGRIDADTVQRLRQALMPRPDQP